MTLETISFSGKNMRDRHTHYEVSTYIGPSPATVIIQGHVPFEFERRYGRPIRECTLSVSIDFIRNDQRVAECQDPFKPAGHQTGLISSLDQITLVE